ncbi:MAG: outer membrane lipoprotein-sorting protein [Verrucomicrobia bacterium]|nr:outer membrane lipoprotein-sorting protein [Verrucomicrobiota bacterium]
MNGLTFSSWLTIAALASLHCLGQQRQPEFGKNVSVAEGQELAREVISQWPERNAVFYGFLISRDGDGKRTKRPLKYSIIVGDEAWQATYEVQPTLSSPGQRLAIIHRENQPNEYLLSPLTNMTSASAQMARVAAPETFLPFAGSDYWLCDLGLEFLHWPEQRLIKDAKITMRSNRACKVLESINPSPAGNGYARVVSWLDGESHAPIYAEAYDRQGKLFKVYSLKGFKKVNGRWQPKEMEIRNENTDSRTHLEFQFETEAAQK